MLDAERVTTLTGLAEAFTRRFGGSARLFSAPGRVNLIGEHTDYNDGFVLPMAIDRRTRVAAAPRDDGRVVAVSTGQPEPFEFTLADPGVPRRGTWGDYVEGTARALIARGVPVRGASLLIDSEVPPGAGLSASAALEIAVGLALASLAGHETIDRMTLALAGQAAEHEYVGTRCGIMDQAIASLGVAGGALLIDCRSLEPRVVSLDLGGARIVVCDTKVKHDLATSAYNERRAECERAAAHFAKKIPGVRSLRDVSLADFERYAHELPDTLLRRARHVVSENGRTLMAAELLEHGELDRLGSLMGASHASLRDDYEVSSPSSTSPSRSRSRSPACTAPA